ncbi:dipeptide/oligopeptide/nickel ABC transporter permease/ATP-binding protein [Streptomyces sp. NPDC048277]|uniref:dipeptide/oligopeptide/nickel ABC transporter permease/ATP-binding protein n=1 Tax=Streptomyces sp. NPDC048277 TaxID=3155027 RepID=UPI00341185F1
MNALAGLPRRLARKRVALASLAFLVLLVALALAAPWLHLPSPTEGELADARLGPGWAHPLGTDQTGRDTLSRLVWGARPSLLYTAEAVTVALAVGIPLGVLAGFVGGRVDRAVIAADDVVMAMPGMVVLLVVLAIFGSHVHYAMIAMGLMLCAPFLRVVRAATLDVRREAFIDAARVAGLSSWRIMWRHVLPRIGGVVLVQGALLTGMALLLSTGIAYLGFGTQPPNPSWGLMIGDGAQIMGSSPWLVLFSGAAIGLTVIACGLAGDGLRDLVTERWSGTTRPVPPPRVVVDRRPAAAPSDTTDDDTVLRVEDLSIRYPSAEGHRTVVHGVNLALRAGETLGLVGESGSGKTAIARAVMGILVGGEIEAGRVGLAGQDITGIAHFAPAQRSRLRMGYVSQEPHASLDPSWRVGHLVAEALRRHRGLTAAQAREAAIALFDQVRLEDPEAVARRYPHELSGGMAQRVAIARALACRPRLLIADEPTTALDVTVQAEILDLLRGIQAETGMALLLITHDWGVVADLCDRAAVLRDGEIVEQGPVLQLYADPQHAYTRTLLASAPTHMIDEFRHEGADK